MSDLISRSTLIDKFNDTGIQITFDLPVEEKLGEDVDLEAFAELVQDAVQSYKKMVIDVIHNQPTAYDVDDGNADIYGAGYKLGYKDGYNIAIDDMEKQITALYKDSLNGTAGDDVLAWNKALDKVIEVIKAGGNNDNR